MLNQAADPFGIIGQVLDSQFRVDRLVGEGGFSAVYRGYHLGLDEPIAVKCLKLPPTLQPQLVEQFERRFRDESRILYRLSQGNLNIVRSIAGGTWQSPMGALVPFMVLEWMEGRSLSNEFTIRRTVGKQGRPLAEVMNVFGSAADALAFAHAQGVIHRDLNPGNFFFANTPQGQRLKVLDFGVAKILDDSSLNIERNQTVGQIRIFAPAYGSPEQFDDSIGKTSAASDVYSFALILMEALRDRPVNDGTHLGEFAQRAIDPRVRPTPRGLGIEVDDEIELIFARATKVAPAERWQSASEFWNALEHATSAAIEERLAQAALETPSLGMPVTGARTTKTGMAPPAHGQGKTPGMKRMDKTVPVGAVMPSMPQPPRPPIPPSAPRIEAAPAPPPEPEEPPGFSHEDATAIGVSPSGGNAPPPVIAEPDDGEGDEVTRVGAPTADVLRGLADAELRSGAGAVTMTQVSQGNQNNRPAAGQPPSGEFPLAPPPPPAPQAGRGPQQMAGTLMMQPGQGFGPLPPPPQAAARPQAPPPPPPPPQAQAQGPQAPMPPPPPAQQAPMQQAPMPPPQPMGYGQPPPQAMQQAPMQQAPMQQAPMPPPQAMQPPPMQQAPMPQAPMQPPMQPPYGGAPQPMADSSLAPAGVPKKSNMGLILGIVFGVLVLAGVGVAVVVVGMSPKADTVPSASASVSAVEVPPPPSAPETTAEPEVPAVPPAAEDDAGASAVAEAAEDAGAEVANTNTNPTPDNGAGTAPVANPNQGGGTWTPPPAQPQPQPAVKDAGAPVDPNAFNEGVARSRLAQANGVLVFCKKEGGVTGPGSATVTFSPDGSVASVAMDAPYAGTPTGDCVAGQFKRQKSNPFQGSPRSVKHQFEVPK